MGLHLPAWSGPRLVGVYCPVVFGDPFPHEKIIANLPSTMTLPFQQGETYEFAVQHKDLKFFNRATGLRTDPRPL